MSDMERPSENLPLGLALDDVLEHWATGLRLRVVGLTDIGRVVVQKADGELWDLDPSTLRATYMKVGQILGGAS